jgi:cytochrome c553
LILAAAPFGFLAAAPAQQGAAPKMVSFANDVQPLLKAKCYGCHNPTTLGGRSETGGAKLDLTTVEGFERGGVSGKLVEPGKPTESLLFVRITGSDGKPQMPLGFPPFSAEQIQTIRDWITQGASTKETRVSFSKDIAPILKAQCLSCHGDKASGGLVLSSGKSIAKGGGSGPIVVPGDPAKSILIKRLKGEDGLEQMPMGFAPFSAEKLALFERWIKEGADLTDTDQTRHWAYVKPMRPKLPEVNDKAWIKNPVDNFVLARLEKEGLKPSPEADRETLIRRVSLDLTGLPPTIKEVDDFLKDKSANAYEKVVDRLLASPHYGERMARPWLDLARFADSDGYERDPRRTAWPWRDWVINAYNHNMPFDEFTIEQLAGDMLPNATMDQIVATGFNRNTMTNQEGGVDQDEALFEVVIDRVSTTSTVWMGSTLGCARCHDHKFDPFTQKDFYQFFAIYNNPEYEGVGDKNVSAQVYFEPFMRVISPEQQKQEAALRDEITAATAALAKSTPVIDAAREQWIKDLNVSWLSPAPSGAESDGGVKLAIEPDGRMVASGENPATAVYTVKYKPGATTISALRLEALTHPSFVRTGPGRSDNGNFVVSRIEVKINGKDAPLKMARASFSQQGFGPEGIFDKNFDTGWAISPNFGRGHEMVVELASPATLKEGDEISITLDQRSQFPQHTLGCFRFSFTNLEHASELAVDPSVRTSAANPNRSELENSKLAKVFGQQGWATEAMRNRLVTAETSLKTLVDSTPSALIMRDKPTTGPLKANIHIKGAYVAKGDEVEAGIPGFLSSVPIEGPVNRLSLAKWLVNKDNPLTARTQVNRFWEMFFGRGIVETSEDLGTQSSPPSHPELLDWLAVEFMDKGWDIKSVLKTIVTSATYRQSSVVTAEMMENDPSNVLLARGPRFRMEAEMIRDNAYAAAGILSPRVGGPSVFPSQPDGIWFSPYSGDMWKNSEGDDFYRRGLYTFWKRTAPYPSFLALDATSRESCTVRRVRTNTPLQALALLNDDAMMVAAKGLAKRMIKDGGASPADRVRLGFRLCTARMPEAAEVDRLVAFYNKMKTKYAGEERLTGALAGDPDAAAWTMVANVLLNLDETLTKG